MDGHEAKGLPPKPVLITRVLLSYDASLNIPSTLLNIPDHMSQTTTKRGSQKPRER